MVDYVKKIANMGVELTLEERNLVSVAYKNVIQARRESWTKAIALQHKEDGKGEEANQLDLETIHMYKQKIKHEIREICHDVFLLLDHHLLPVSITVENKVFFYKMQDEQTDVHKLLCSFVTVVDLIIRCRKGDYYRYLMDITIEEKRQEFAENSLVAYTAGTEIARVELSPTHPIR